MGVCQAKVFLFSNSANATFSDLEKTKIASFVAKNFRTRKILQNFGSFSDRETFLFFRTKTFLSPKNLAKSTFVQNFVEKMV